MDNDYGLPEQGLRVIEFQVNESKPPKAKPGCGHGGAEEGDPAQPCDRCFLGSMKAADRYGLWQEVPPARPTKKRKALA